MLYNSPAFSRRTSGRTVFAVRQAALYGFCANVLCQDCYMI